MAAAAAVAAALIFTLISAMPAFAEKRVALVIGNAAYRTIPALTNPANDAEDVGRELRQLGFEAIVATDLDRSGMNNALDRFSRLVVDADIAFVYYSGHGMQFAGKNYLLPVDARLTSADDVNKFRLTPLDDVLEVLQAARGARVVVLDACRNNPVEEDLKRRLASLPGANRDAFLVRGLGRVSAGNGLIVAYSTQANDVAADGIARNSPFTSAFLHHVGAPDVDLRQMLFRVQDEVDRTTRGRQRPELSISLVGEFKLQRSGAAVAPASPSAPSVAPPPAVVRPPPAPVALPPSAPARTPRPRAAGESCATLAAPAGTDLYCASSVLAPQFGNSYGVRNLFGPDESTAWVEGVAGQGVGQWIVVEFDGLRLVRNITLRNGYQKNADIFGKNGRVRQLRLVFSGGESQVVVLEDRRGPQVITMDRPIKSYWVQLVIDEVYPGWRYPDTAISKLAIGSERSQ